MSRLHFPTDAEISAMVGGIPVISCHPEDFPHWKDSKYEPLTHSQHPERALAIHDLWSRFDPEISGLYDASREDSLKRSAAVRMFFLHQNGRREVIFFALLKPSKLLDAESEIAEDIGPYGHPSFGKISSTTPKEDWDYITIYHEIGHMKALSQNLEFKNDNIDELYAETHGIREYLKNGGSEKVAKERVYYRALSGFLDQPYKYWFTTSLYNNLFGENSTSDSRWEDDFYPNAELRLRVTDMTDGAGMLRHYSSAKIHEALGLFDQGQVDEIEDPYLRNAVRKLDTIRNDEDSVYSRHPAATFTAIGEIMKSENIDIRTRELAALVMEGAKTFTPHLLPEALRSARVTHDAVPSTKRALSSLFDQAVDVSGFRTLSKVCKDTCGLFAAAATDMTNAIRAASPITAAKRVHEVLKRSL